MPNNAVILGSSAIPTFEAKANQHGGFGQTGGPVVLPDLNAGPRCSLIIRNPFHKIT